MTEQCPNCSKEFIDQRETAYRCEVCGWLTKIDGQWHPCKEPADQVEPDPPDAEPKPEPKPAPESVTRKVRRLFGGLVTVTEIEDDDEENN